MHSRFDVVFFDCDSTLSTLEGIDELARRRGVVDEVATLTAQSMEGTVALEDVYARRLAIVRPDADDLAWLGQLYCDHLTEGASEVVHRLHDAGVEVHVVSGGLRPALLPLAEVLGIGAARVHAVDVVLDSEGRYVDFDRTAPTARSGGKVDVVQRVAGARRCAMVGDGITDLEAREAGAFVIGYGGVVVREAVRQGADAWVEDSLLGVLDVIFD